MTSLPVYLPRRKYDQENLPLPHCRDSLVPGCEKNTRNFLLCFRRVKLRQLLLCNPQPGATESIAADPVCSRRATRPMDDCLHLVQSALIQKIQESGQAHTLSITARKISSATAPALVAMSLALSNGTNMSNFSNEQPGTKHLLTSNDIVNLHQITR